MKKKMIFFVSLVFVIGLFLTSCTQATNTASSGAANDSSEGSADVVEQEKDTSAKVVRVLAVSGPETDSLIASAAEFEQATGITASIEQVSRSLWGERKVRELLQDSGIYDVVMIGGGDDLVWVTQKAHVLPLDDYLSADDKAQLMHADFFTKDGSLFGVPQYYNFPMLFYRKDLMEDPQEQAAFREKYDRDLTVPTNFDELQQVAEFFNRPPEMAGFCMGGVDWSIFLDFTYFLYGAGGNFGDLNTGELTLDSPEFVRALDAMTRMVAYNPTGWETMSFFDCDTQMLEGKAFMYQNWFYAWTTFQQETPDTIAMAPVTGDAQPGAHIGAMVAVIPQAAPDPDAAGQFISWMLGAQYQTEMMNATGNMPVRQDLISDPEIRSALVGIEMYEKTVPYLTYQHTTWPNELDSGVTEAIWKIFKGEMTAQEAADWLQNDKFADRKAVE